MDSESTVWEYLSVFQQSSDFLSKSEWTKAQKRIDASVHAPSWAEQLAGIASHFPARLTPSSRTTSAVFVGLRLLGDLEMFSLASHSLPTRFVSLLPQTNTVRSHKADPPDRCSRLFTRCCPTLVFRTSWLQTELWGHAPLTLSLHSL